jgi:hypothetical protein
MMAFPDPDARAILPSAVRSEDRAERPVTQGRPAAPSLAHDETPP